MNNQVFSQYNQASDLLDSHQVMATPAEIHGVLCGLLCGGINLKDHVWLHEFNQLVNDGQPMPEPVITWLDELFRASVASITEGSGLELLLPDDEFSTEEQLLAIIDWSQAFLAGFAVMQQDLAKASDELQEMLSDITDITQLDVDSMSDDGSDDASFYVLYEHLKLGVIMAYEEFGQRIPSSKQQTLH